MEALVTGVFTASAIFILIIGGSLIWFLFKARLICARKHNTVESLPEPAENGNGRKEKKPFSDREAPKFQEKNSPHPTMGGVFPLSTLLSAENARRRQGEPRDPHMAGPQPSRRPNLQPLMEPPTPSSLVLPSVTRISIPPSPYTPIQIEHHPYAQTRGYGSP
jgi:hypothetical protein